MLTSENKLRRGRHVGLDFYDLLIEALMGDAPGTPPGRPTTAAGTARDGGAIKFPTPKMLKFSVRHTHLKVLACPTFCKSPRPRL